MWLWRVFAVNFGHIQPRGGSNSILFGFIHSKFSRIECVLGLTISLWMVTRQKADVDIELPKEHLPNPGDKLQASVRVF